MLSYHILILVFAIVGVACIITYAYGFILIERIEKKQREEFYEKMRENDLILLLGEHHPKYKEALRQFQKNMRMKQTKEKGQNNEVHGQ